MAGTGGGNLARGPRHGDRVQRAEEQNSEHPRHNSYLSDGDRQREQPLGQAQGQGEHGSAQDAAGVAGLECGQASRVPTRLRKFLDHMA